MATNRAFHTNNLHSIATERSLYESLIQEAIQIYGHDVYYINRDTVALDNVLGEDSLSKFTRQHPIEMYVEDAEGFGGDKEIITQFGLENRNEITFILHKKRFQEMDRQVQIEVATDNSSSGSILLEAGTLDQSNNCIQLNTLTPSFIFNENEEKIVLENDSECGELVQGGRLLSEESGNEFYLLADTAATDADRPQEGDLIYHPVIKKMFEINFVDHDEPFHQLDNNPVYKLRCKQFEYSSEDISTGITDIDAIEDELSTSSSAFQFTLENEVGVIQLENPADTGDAEFLISEDYIIGDYVTDKTAQNELFDELDDTVLDFSESNPFGDVGDNT